MGAGLTDISSRLGQGGLAEAVVLPVTGPYVVGCLPVDGHQRPLKEGEVSKSCLPNTKDQANLPKSFQFDDLVLGYFLHDRAKFRARAVGTISGVRPGDKVVVRNVDKGLERSAHVNARGHFRIGIPADALWPVERRSLLGLTDDDYGPAAPFADTPKLGDRMTFTVYEGDTDKVRGSLDAFAWQVEFQGTTYAEKAPLVALQEGLGYQRNTPDFRQFFQIASHAIAQADPAVWAQHYFLYPIEAPYDPNWWPGRMHALVMPTIGDHNVPVATGVALGRTSGLLGSWVKDPNLPAEQGWRAIFSPDPRYGVSVDQWLIDRYVVEGDDRLERYSDFAKPTPGVLFDPDNVSDGAASFTCGDSDWSAQIGENGCTEDYEGKEVFFSVPTPDKGKELRLDHKRADGSHDAFRIPLIRPVGQHGIYNPQPFRVFDADAYMQNWNSRFMVSRGVKVSHEAGCDCSGLGYPGYKVKGKDVWPGISGGACQPSWMKVCSPTCAEAWGFRDVGDVVCAP